MTGVAARQACHYEEMSETTRVTIRTEHADGSVKEYWAADPTGLILEFTEDGGIEAHTVSGKSVSVGVMPLPAP
jgi:hypothetical protein